MLDEFHVKCAREQCEQNSTEPFGGTACLKTDVHLRMKQASQGVADESEHQEEQEHQELVNLFILEAVAARSASHVNHDTSCLSGLRKGFMKLKCVFQIRHQDDFVDQIGLVV